MVAPFSEVAPYPEAVLECLRIAAQTTEGTWLAVALVEEDDDKYLVVRAHGLEQAKVAAVRAMIEGDVP